jgi:hypothetical protein
MLDPHEHCVDSGNPALPDTMDSLRLEFTFWLLMSKVAG